FRGIPGPPGAKGNDGAKGDDGTKWYFGSGAPDSGTLIYPSGSLGDYDLNDGDLWLDTNTTKIYAYQDVPPATPTWVDTTTVLSSSFFNVSGSNYYLDNRDGNLIVGWDGKSSPAVLSYPVNPDAYRFRVVS